MLHMRPGKCGKRLGCEMTASDERGSGTAIGVAIIFPMLLLVIVVLQGITFTSRTEQALQAIADRAAHTASLCCLHVGDATNAASESIALHAGPWGRLQCQNDVASDTAVEFRDVTGALIPALRDPTDLNSRNVVPAGGYARVLVRCELAPSHAGMFLPLADVSRSVLGVATIDPFRHRALPTR